MRFATRTFLWSFVPFAVLLLGAFWQTQRFVGLTVREGVRLSLRQTHASIARVRSKSELQDSRFLRILGENASLKAGLQLLNAEPSSAEARRTVEEQLRELCEVLGFDFLVASRPGAGVVAGVMRVHEQIVSMDIARVRPPERGFVTVAGQAYQVVSTPINQGDENLGTLSIGDRFDFSEFSTPAVLTRDGAVLLSSFPGVSLPEIEAAMRGCSHNAECEVRLNGESYISLPMESLHFGDGCVLRSLQSIDAANGPVQGVLRRVFLITAFGTLLATVILTVLAARGIVRPIGRVISHLQQAEQTGVFPEFEAPAHGTPVREIAQLTDTFNRAARAMRDAQFRLQEAYFQFTESLASALDARDRYTAGHSRRVSDLSCAIARAMNVSPASLEQIRMGALLHDIGKIGIADNVLQKPGPLTVEETRLIEEHPTIGRRILEGVSGFQPYLRIVELHHENWNGSGYPCGLRAEAVPVEARIVHLADAYDAMTTDRPYRRGMTHAEAVRTLQQSAGAMFDPAVVAAFVEAISYAGDESTLAAALGGIERAVRGKGSMMRLVLAVCLLPAAVHAQDANSGFELRASFSSTATIPTEAPHPVAADVRSLLYPTWKLSSHWAVAGAIQTRVQLSHVADGSVNLAPGERDRTDVLQAYLSYSRIWKNGSFNFRVGQLSTTFGSFMLRYDDAQNPLIRAPLAYGYYSPVSPAGVAGAEVDLTLGKLDVRAQAANSSPANPRSLTDSDQYRNWAGGIGYTIRQGLRVGVSGYRGPYLDRHYRYYFPGEAKPRDLPASGWGADAQWGSGPWNVFAEWQHFQMTYRAIPNFWEHTGYVETRRVLNPRWYIAARVGYLRASAFPGEQAYEIAGGFRPGARQLLKIGYQIDQSVTGRRSGGVSLQFVTTLRALAVAAN